MKSVITCAVALTALVAFASPAKAQGCEEFSGGEVTVNLCGFVWNDTNGDGIQNDDTDLAMDGDQSGINGLQVFIFEWIPPTGTTAGHWSDAPVADTFTDNGLYTFANVDDGVYKVVVAAPEGKQLSPTGVGDDSFDSDGTNDTGGSAVKVTLGSGGVLSQDSDFGFKPKSTETAPLNPGTGTPGYWKNHTDVWDGVTIGGKYYTADQAAVLMGKVSKDKTISLFSQLVAAKLSVEIGNDASCIAAKIAEADAWMKAHPVGSNIAASSSYWQQIAQTHTDLDDYNNGRLCAPHRK